MKKIAVLFALAALATAGGCVSNAGQFCLKQAECAEEEDPAKFCTDAEAEAKDNETATKLQAACAAEIDAAAACFVANGKCEDKFFGLEAAGADGACEDQAKDQFDCFADNL